MIELNEYKYANAQGVYGGWMDYETFKHKSRSAALSSWDSEGIKACRWPGFIVVRCSTQDKSGHMKTYYYRNEPNTPWHALYRIDLDNNTLEEM